MTIINTHAKSNRAIRRLNRRIKNLHNEAKAYRDEAIYQQAVHDNIVERFNLTEEYKQIEPCPIP